jgi:hypothetical protein
MTVGIIGTGMSRDKINSIAQSLSDVTLPVLMLDKEVEYLNTVCIKAAEAGELLRKTLINLSLDIPEESESKKTQFFQRDIVPNKNRRFGNR